MSKICCSMSSVCNLGIFKMQNEGQVNLELYWSSCIWGTWNCWKNNSCIDGKLRSWFPISLNSIVFAVHQVPECQSKCRLLPVQHNLQDCWLASRRGVPLNQLQSCKLQRKIINLRKLTRRPWLPTRRWIKGLQEFTKSTKSHALQCTKWTAEVQPEVVQGFPKSWQLDKNCADKRLGRRLHPPFVHLLQSRFLVAKDSIGGRSVAGKSIR